MKYRQLGTSDLQVSEIALGSWLTFGSGVERREAVACVRQALEVGINLFDSANVYGHGAAEALLAEALVGVARDRYLLATKLFFPMGPADRGLSRVQIFKQLDASLKRLRTDVIDLYQCHRHDPDTPLEETMAALTEVVRQGKVRWVGFSEWPPEQIEAALALPGVVRFVSSQPQYSLLWRAPEHRVIPLCAAQGISQIVWSPLAQGLLTGKYRSGRPLPPDSRAASLVMGGFFRRDLLRPAVLDAIDQVRALAEAAGLSLAQFALAWTLRNPNVASAIIGTTKPAQVAENAAASGSTIDPAQFTEAERILARVIPVLANG